LDTSTSYDDGICGLADDDGTYGYSTAFGSYGSYYTYLPVRHVMAQ